MTPTPLLPRFELKIQVFDLHIIDKEIMGYIDINLVDTCVKSDGVNPPRLYHCYMFPLMSNSCYWHKHMLHETRSTGYHRQVILYI